MQVDPLNWRKHTGSYLQKIPQKPERRRNQKSTTGQLSRQTKPWANLSFQTASVVNCKTEERLLPACLSQPLLTWYYAAGWVWCPGQNTMMSHLLVSKTQQVHLPEAGTPVGWSNVVYRVNAKMYNRCTYDIPKKRVSNPQKHILTWQICRRATEERRQRHQLPPAASLLNMLYHLVELSGRARDGAEQPVLIRNPTLTSSCDCVSVWKAFPLRSHLAGGDSGWKDAPLWIYHWAQDGVTSCKQISARFDWDEKSNIPLLRSKHDALLWRRPELNVDGCTGNAAMSMPEGQTVWWLPSTLQTPAGGADAKRCSSCAQGIQAVDACRPIYSECIKEKRGVMFTHGDSFSK